MRKILDTIMTIFFSFAAILASLVVAGFVAWICTIVISIVLRIYPGWEISQTVGTIIAVIIAALMLVSFWGKLLFPRKKKKK